MYCLTTQNKKIILMSFHCKLSKQRKVFWICSYFRVHGEEKAAMRSSLLTAIRWNSVKSVLNLNSPISCSILSKAAIKQQNMLVNTRLWRLLLRILSDGSSEIPPSALLLDPWSKYKRFRIAFKMAHYVHTIWRKSKKSNTGSEMAPSESQLAFLSNFHSHSSLIHLMPSECSTFLHLLSSNPSSFLSSHMTLPDKFFPVFSFSHQPSVCLAYQHSLTPLLPVSLNQPSKAILLAVCSSNVAVVIYTSNWICIFYLWPVHQSS